MRSRARSAAALSAVFLVLTLAGCHSVFGLDEYELVTESSSGTGGLGTGGATGGTSATGGAGTGADGGAGGTEPVAPADCCVDDAGPPEGWTFAIVTREAGDAGNPSCLGSGVDPLALMAGEPGPAMCEGCSCGTPEGGSCQQTLTCFRNTGCGGDQVSVGPGCNSAVVQAVLPTRSCLRTLSVAQQASCPPSVTSTTLPAWDYKHLACPDDPANVVEGQCDEGQHCIGGAAGAQVCIWQEGFTQCPAEGGFTEAIEVFEEGSIVDTRGCGGCVCSPPDTSCTGGSYHYGGAVFQCDTTSTSTSCVNTGDIYTAGIKTAATLTIDGSCSASGNATPQGDTDQKTAYTLCCRRTFQ